MPNVALHIDEDLSAIRLIPAPVQVFGRNAKLDDEIARKVFGLDLPAFLAPEPKECGLIIAQNDPCIGSADEIAPVLRLLRRHEELPHLFKIPYRRTSSLLRSRPRMRRMFQGAQTTRITAVAHTAVRR